MSPDKPNISAESPDASRESLMQSFAALPHKKLFDPKNASSEEHFDPTAWRQETDFSQGRIEVRATSQYGECVQPLGGGFEYYRPSADGEHLVETVRNRLAEAGFDVSDERSPASLYAENFGVNLGLGMSPSEALSRAYAGEYGGSGEPENRMRWPDRWPEGYKKPQQWDFEDLLGIIR